jgi:hypothetical protein
MQSRHVERILWSGVIPNARAFTSAPRDLPLHTTFGGAEDFVEERRFSAAWSEQNAPYVSEQPHG